MFNKIDPMKSLLILPILFLNLIFSTSIIAQESPATPDIPVDLLIRHQVEGMMIQQTEVILEKYHKDVQLIKFPNERLATGRDEAMKFWEKKFSEEKEVAYDILNYLESDNYYFTKIRRFDQVKGKESFLAIIYMIKDGKVMQVYFL